MCVASEKAFPDSGSFYSRSTIKCNKCLLYKSNKSYAFNNIHWLVEKWCIGSGEQKLKKAGRGGGALFISRVILFSLRISTFFFHSHASSWWNMNGGAASSTLVPQLDSVAGWWWGGNILIFSLLPWAIASFALCVADPLLNFWERVQLSSKDIPQTNAFGRSFTCISTSIGSNDHIFFKIGSTVFFYQMTFDRHCPSFSRPELAPVRWFCIIICSQEPAILAANKFQI